MRWGAWPARSATRARAPRRWSTGVTSCASASTTPPPPSMPTGWPRTPTPPSSGRAVRVIETRWQAGDLTPDGLADRMVEVAIRCTDDTAALDEALNLLSLTDDGTLLPALRQVLQTRPASDAATDALRARLADRTPA